MGKCHAAVVIEDVCGNRPVRWGGGKKKKVFIQENTAEKLPVSCF